MSKSYRLILSNEYVNVILYKGRSIQLSSNIDIDTYIEELEKDSKSHLDNIYKPKNKK